MMQLYKSYPSSLSACFSFYPLFMHLSPLILVIFPLFNFFMQSLLKWLILLLVFHTLPRLLHAHLYLSFFLARSRWSLAHQQWQFRVQHPQLGSLPSAGGSAHRPLEGVGEVEGAVCNPNKGIWGGLGGRDGHAETLNVAPYEPRGASILFMCLLGLNSISSCLIAGFICLC